MSAIAVIGYIIFQIWSDLSRNGLDDMFEMGSLDIAYLQQVSKSVFGLYARRICKLALLALAAVSTVELALVSFSALITEEERIGQQCSALKGIL